jgi:DNA-binding NarL/FixJ family response regulator
MVTIAVAEPLAGVRDAMRAILQRTPGFRIISEVETLREALVARGDVVVAGLRFPDGDVSHLCGQRPVVVVTTLPADERSEVDLSDAAAVVRFGELSALLAPATLAVAKAARAAQSRTAAAPASTCDSEDSSEATSRLLRARRVLE